MRTSQFMFNDCVLSFLAHLQRQGYSKETSYGYSKDLELFREFMENRFLGKDFEICLISKQIIHAFMDDGRQRGNKASTIGRRVATLKSFFKYLVYDCDYPDNVASRIRIPKVYTPLKFIPTEEEVHNLLSVSRALGSYFHLLFSLLYFTGSRITPVRLLERQHVHLEEKMIYFSKVKGGKDLYLPLNPILVDLFTEHFSLNRFSNSSYVFPSTKDSRNPVSASYIRIQLKKAAELANLNVEISPHTLRHCTATHLTIKNVPQYKIASILGHCDLRSTMRYQHLAVDHLRSPLNLLGDLEDQ